MSFLDLIACLIGYTVSGLGLAIIALNLWAWVWWPVAHIVADIRFFFADPESGGWETFKWLGVLSAYWILFKAYPREIFTYCEGTTTHHGIGVWHHPTHPFSLGRIVWFKSEPPPSDAERGGA
jgi:hypothetical protein